MVKYVHKSACMGGSTNSSFLALVPKDVNPSAFNRLRHISLCNLSYKIISKVIENIRKPFFLDSIPLIKEVLLRKENSLIILSVFKRLFIPAKSERKKE
jgi:hypothetical protein